jgi:hypothetical protein
MTREDALFVYCHICKNIVYGNCYTFDHLKYHGNCLRCRKCRLRLNYITATRVNNDVYCDNHARGMMFFYQCIGTVCEKRILTDISIVCTTNSSR